jgi:hypothetical protein
LKGNIQWDLIRLHRRPRLRAGTSMEKESQKLHFGVQARPWPWRNALMGNIPFQ